MNVAAGQSYKLRTPTLGLTSCVDGKRHTVLVPQEAVVRILSVPPEGPMVHVVFEAELLTMFLQDLRDRGEEVPEA
jgi:hypothetical protein